MKKWEEYYQSRLVSADEAISHIKSNQRIFLTGNAAIPKTLLEALLKIAHTLENVELNHLLTFGEDYFSKYPGIRHNAWFIGPSIRKAVNEGKADYIPIFLSEIAKLVRSGAWEIDVALIHVSPPDRYGFMSYGVETSITKPCAEAAKLVIAQVNRKMPRALGDSFIHISEVDYFVEADDDLFELKNDEFTVVEKQIAENVAKLVENGATLQLGIGGIPNAVLKALENHVDLGIHTEMFSDGILPLLEGGVITNQKKGLHRGKVIAGFCIGSRELYNYIDNNPIFEFHPNHYTNDPYLIAQNNKMTAINSAIEVDLTGQVCADSIGENIYSGIGGQVDFIRGAARCPTGKPIIALPSTAKNGTVSRIVPTLSKGAGVVTSRGDVHWVVTEYGAVNLFGKNLRQRAELLISIAHPDFRSWLRKESKWIEKNL
ncbi:MAG: 4-hydroxybutyrate CoA-transferase [Leptospiraceae bacterium]|nr:4-hydroxybutyrate CoA-transferase [Leptospiraceae bacterium]MDW7974948.1 acetyl-CoA hydrolase/transferase C-terminal domain-containing protein [Leptospiraceae bacterium]